MKNLEHLLALYRDDARTTTIIEQLKDKSNRLLLSGLIGAQEACVLSGTYLSKPQHHLFIAIDKEEAAYVQNNITALLDKKAIHFFPDSFKQPTKFKELNNRNVLLRAESMNKISNSRTSGEIIVTYPEALFEKVVSPKVLDNHKIEIKIKETWEVDDVIELFVDCGFERVDFVYEPGQFAIRGGIVDIYSYGNELPYRIELFDDEVETIRTFDPMTQLSEKKISKITIVPNIQTQFKQSEKVSLLKILPENTAVWIKSVQNLLDRLQICFEKAEEFGQTIGDSLNLAASEEARIIEERAFIYPRDIVEDMLGFPIIELGKSSFFEQTKDSKQPAITKIEYKTKPQPSFNKNFELLIKDFNDNNANQIENYLFTDNPRQIERFYHIFEDMGADVHFHPIQNALHQGFIDHELKVACYTDHQIFERYHKFKIKGSRFSKSQAINIKLLRELQPGDYVTHIDHGVGKYSGLEKIDINGHIQETVRLIYKDNDLLYVSINSLHKIARYVGKEGTAPKVHKLGSESWKNVKAKTKKRVKDIAAELIKLYAKRKSTKGFAFPPDGWMQTELESSFIYEDTPDQYKATQDVKEDMQKPYPMDRLICGDVGFGKTEIAIRAAFKSVANGKQAAILVPTTILALQHFKTFSDRLEQFDVTIDYVNRFKTAKQKTEIYKRLEKGEIDILIGTHSILNKKVKFKDLGLLVIDEEQKFGVASKEKLRSIKINVDTLALTATPIPRTLQFSLMAARDLSVMNTPPPNRQPIHTEVRVFNDELIRDSIYYEIYRGGQVFFLHNRVKSLPEMVGMLKKLCPDVDFGMAHGQMQPKDLEKTLVDFIDKKYDVLVCTNIIETGLDIPNANTIIINNAHHFGLSDLHQLRGRVGRSNKKAFCYLFCPPLSVLTSDARKRLRTLEEFSDLGSGFNIAMRDLDIRGAGNLLGGEQSGFISNIGYETYQKILNQAILELKETDFKDLFKEDLNKKREFVQDVLIETDVEMLIPDNYIQSIQERLNIYKELDEIKDEAGIDKFKAEIEDRFGKIPVQVHELFNGLKLRWLCKELGFERLILKKNKLRCYFVSNPQSVFYESDVFQKMMIFVSKKADRKLSFKKSNNYFILVKEGVNKVRHAELLLEEIKEAVL
ncbi:MAG: transcription-repair coupling factor [Saprospiraceae bacterium]